MLGAIWAESIDGIIGDGVGMPWHLPEDLRHFKEITLGHPIIMGRKTWDHLPIKPLPGRTNHVLSSREPGEWSDGAFVSRDIPDLKTSAWIIGGGQIYEATIDEVDVIERTIVDVHVADKLGASAVRAPRVTDDFAIVSDGPWHTSANGTRFKHQRLERLGPKS